MVTERNVASDMHDPETAEEPANLKFLRRLVTTLTLVMIAGVVIIVALLVIRVQQAQAPIPLPSEITLPQGKTATAFTRGADWYAVVTIGNEILIYDAATSELRQRISIKEE